MKILVFCVFLIFFSNGLNAQVNTGIKFEHDLTWEQVLLKAKEEHKYIFVDCYTTWCGPCKIMDRDVYPKENVGIFFNQYFISVRIQMDKTEKDDQKIVEWYGDAQHFVKKYGVDVFPTYLFFSPQGELVGRDQGYKNSTDLLLISKNFIVLNVQFPYKKYYKDIENYESGERNYIIMPALIDTAKLLGQKDKEEIISSDLRNHLLVVKDSLFYLNVNLSFLASDIKTSLDPFFGIFYAKGAKIDSTMGVKGYAECVVDKIIRKEELDPAILSQQESGISDDIYKLKPEPDWISLKKRIADKYSIDFANRNVLIAQVKWWQDHRDWSKCASYLTLLEKTYYMESNDEDTDGALMFTIWWAIFDRSVDKEQIDIAIECMKGIVHRAYNRGDLPICFIDTYANLLYKAGRVDEAIQQEETGLDEAIRSKQPEGIIKDCKMTIDRMKAGKPTWPRYIDKDDIFGNGLI